VTQEWERELKVRIWELATNSTKRVRSASVVSICGSIVRHAKLANLLAKYSKLGDQVSKSMVKSYSTVGITEEMNLRNRNNAWKRTDGVSNHGGRFRFSMKNTPDQAALPSMLPSHPPSAQKPGVRFMASSERLKKLEFQGAIRKSRMQ
jgi:hypothetical protein